MDKVHPLTEAVARAMFARGRANDGLLYDRLDSGAKEQWREMANAAIRAALTFEPTEAMIEAGTTEQWRWRGASPGQTYTAMTAALMKEVEDAK